MLERLRVTRIVDAEAERLASRLRERPDLRIVRIRHDDRVDRELGDRTAPTLGDLLQLAVAVELVAEQVPEADRPRPDPAHHLGKMCLVELEEAELGARRRGNERGDDPGHEVRPGAVVRELEARREDLRDHRARRRLPVRRRDDGGPQRQPGREPVERARIDPPQELAGQRRAASGSREARCAPDEPRPRQLEPDRKPKRHAGEPTGDPPNGGCPLEGAEASLEPRSRYRRRPA